MAGNGERLWATAKRTEVFRGRVRVVDHTVVLADGTQMQYEVDESIAFAVATLVIENGMALLTRQYRYPINRWIYDLPGGAGTAGETPRDAAARELEEEVGLIPNDLAPLQTYFVNPGRAAWPVHVFICDAGTQRGVADRSNPAEQVESARLRISDLDDAITSGEITDPTLIIARAAAAVRGRLPPLGKPTCMPPGGTS